MGGYPIGAGQTLVLPATQILVLIFPAKFFGEMAGRLAPLGEMAGGSSTCTQYVISSEGQTNRTGWFQNFPQGNLFNSYVGFYRGSTAGMHVRYPPGMDFRLGDVMGPRFIIASHSIFRVRSPSCIVAGNGVCRRWSVVANSNKSTLI